MFLRLCSGDNQVRARSSLRSLTMETISRQSYDGIKTLAKDNAQAKRELVSKLLSVGCGRWVAKPVEQDQFYMGYKPMMTHVGDKTVLP